MGTPSVVISESNGSNKGLNDWTLDEELMDHLAGLVASEANSGEQLLATSEEETRLTKRMSSPTNIVDGVLRDFAICTRTW